MNLRSSSLPSREALEERREETLVAGRALKADIWTARLPGERRVVVKDFWRKPLWGRLWGWVQVVRERRLLTRLDGLDAVPRLVYQLDRYALVIDFVEGRSLCSTPPAERTVWHVSQLREILDELRARGIVHNDLRCKANVYVRASDGRVVLLDWAGGVHLEPGGWAHRLLFERLRLVDEAGYLKWKEYVAPDTITAADREFRARFLRLRALWPFNRKGLGGSRG